MRITHLSLSNYLCNACIFIIFFLNFQGETLGRTEATEAFFAMTKLFQSKDVILRRLVYLAIKELSTIADDVIIVTSRYDHLLNFSLFPFFVCREK